MTDSIIDSIGVEEWRAMASEILIATADTSDQDMDEGITSILSMLRTYMKMDAVFVAEFTNGKQVFRYLDIEADRPVVAVGESLSLEQTWCQRVVDGRLPPLIPNVALFRPTEDLPPLSYDIGTYLSTPVILTDGRLYGTLCAFSFSPSETIQQQDLTNLKAVALVLAHHLRHPVG